MFANLGIWLTGTFNSDKNPMISPDDFAIFMG